MVGVVHLFQDDHMISCQANCSDNAGIELQLSH